MASFATGSIQQTVSARSVNSPRLASGALTIPYRICDTRPKNCAPTTVVVARPYVKRQGLSTEPAGRPPADQPGPDDVGDAHRLRGRDQAPDQAAHRGSRLLVEEPRLGLLLPAWIGALPSLQGRTACILVLRSPDEVAASLAAYDDVPAHRCLMLRLKHVLEAERATRYLPGIVVMHDDIVRDHRGVVGKIGDALRLAGLPGAGRPAGDEDGHAPDPPKPVARQAAARESALTSLCRQAWFALSSLTTNGADRAARAELDRIDRAYRDAAGLFGPMIAASQKILADVEQTRRDEAELFEARTSRHEEVAKDRDRRPAALTVDVER